MQNGGGHLLYKNKMPSSVLSAKQDHVQGQSRCPDDVVSLSTASDFRVGACRNRVPIHLARREKLHNQKDTQERNGCPRSPTQRHLKRGELETRNTVLLLGVFLL